MTGFPDMVVVRFWMKKWKPTKFWFGWHWAKCLKCSLKDEQDVARVSSKEFALLVEKNLGKNTTIRDEMAGGKSECQKPNILSNTWLVASDCVHDGHSSLHENVVGCPVTIATETEKSPGFPFFAAVSRVKLSKDEASSFSTSVVWLEQQVYLEMLQDNRKLAPLKSWLISLLQTSDCNCSWNLFNLTLGGIREK